MPPVTAPATPARRVVRPAGACAPLVKSSAQAINPAAKLATVIAKEGITLPRPAIEIVRDLNAIARPAPAAVKLVNAVARLTTSFASVAPTV